MFRTPACTGPMSPDCNPALDLAAQRYGTLRYRTMTVVDPHSGYRAEQLRKLKSHHGRLGKRSVHVKTYGKRGHCQVYR